MGKARARLVGTGGHTQGHEYELAGDEVTIGRDEKCTIVLQDKRLSAVHALLGRRFGSYHISDCHSANGTQVNNRYITEETTLAHGDQIALGQCLFRFEMDATSEPEPIDVGEGEEGVRRRKGGTVVADLLALAKRREVRIAVLLVVFTAIAAGVLTVIGNKPSWFAELFPPALTAQKAEGDQSKQRERKTKLPKWLYWRSFEPPPELTCRLNWECQKPEGFITPTEMSEAERRQEVLSNYARAMESYRDISVRLGNAYLAYIRFKVALGYLEGLRDLQGDLELMGKRSEMESCMEDARDHIWIKLRDFRFAYLQGNRLGHFRYAWINAAKAMQVLTRRYQAHTDDFREAREVFDKAARELVRRKRF